MLCTLFCVAVVTGPYAEAFTKASDAAYIQTGARDQMELVRRYAEHTSSKYVKKMKLDPVVGLYGLYRRREISFPVRNDTVTIRPTEIIWTHRW